MHEVCAAHTIRLLLAGSSCARRLRMQQPRKQQEAQDYLKRVHAESAARRAKAGAVAKTKAT